MKTVLVTGGTTRLGRAIAEGLRAAGWRVLTSSSRADAGADLVADLSDPLGAAKLYAACLARLGGDPPDALVNNAAIFIGDDAKVVRIGYDSPRKLVMMMAGRETGRGAVVNILDAGVPAFEAPGETAYSRAKRLLADDTRRSAALFAGTLRVNGVAPGPVFAPTDVHVAAGETLLGRPAPEDVAKAVAFLLEAESTTGCIIPVDGGQSLL